MSEQVAHKGFQLENDPSYLLVRFQVPSCSVEDATSCVDSLKATMNDHPLIVLDCSSLNDFQGTALRVLTLGATELKGLGAQIGMVAQPGMIRHIREKGLDRLFHC